MSKSDQEKNPLSGFIGGSTGRRYPDFQGERLVNATVINATSASDRSSSMLVPRIGRQLRITLSGIQGAHTSYSINTSIIVRNTSTTCEVYTANLQFGATTITLIKSFPQPCSDKPLFVDTFDKVVFAIDGVGYVIDKSFNVTTITGLGWAYPTSLDFIDGYVVLSVKDSRQFVRSELNGTAFTDTINFSYLQQSTNVKNLAVVDKEIYIFTEKATEVWWNSGASADQPFSSQNGKNFSYGCFSENTLTIDGLAFNACRSMTIPGVFKWSSNGPEKISNDAVDQALEGAFKVRLSTSVENNRRFIHTLINDVDLWSFDPLSQQWSERTNQLPVDFIYTKEDFFICDSQGIHEIVGSTDNGSVITSTRVSPHITQMQLRVFHLQLELDCGGDISQMQMEFSDDGGQGWSNMQQTSVAKIGHYNRYRFLRLGSSRDRVYRLKWDGSPIYSAMLTVEIGEK